MADRTPIDPRLVDLLYDEIDPEDARALRAEIAADAALQRQWQELEALHEGLGRPEPVRPPARLRSAILDAAERRGGAATPTRRWRAAWAPAAFVAAAAIALAILVPRLAGPPRAPGFETATAPSAPAAAPQSEHSALALAPRAAAESETEELFAAEDARSRAAQPPTTAAPPPAVAQLALAEDAGEASASHAPAPASPSAATPSEPLPLDAMATAPRAAGAPRARSVAEAGRSPLGESTSSGRTARSVPAPSDDLEHPRDTRAGPPPPLVGVAEAHEARARRSEVRSAPDADRVAAAPAAPPAPDADGASARSAAPEGPLGGPPGAVGAGRGAGAPAARGSGVGLGAGTPPRAADHVEERDAQAVALGGSPASAEVRAERAAAPRLEGSRLERRIASLDRDDPDRPRLMLRAAAAAERSGDTPGALRWLERLLVEHPNSAEAERARVERNRLR